MQVITIACSVLFVIIDFAQAQEDISLYTKRYERLDIDTILASPRLVTNYVECLLNKKPCAPEGKALKRILPEALRTKCGRCQPSQKEIALKVITALYFDYPQYYKALREKWDPSGDYNTRFEEYLRDQKFNSIGGGAESEAGEQAQGSSFSINITQRPTRQGQGAQGQQASGQAQTQEQGGQQAQDNKPSATTTDEKDLPEILNRFGSDDEDSGYDYESPSNNGNNSPNSGGSSRPSGTNSGSGSLPSHTWSSQHNQPSAPGFSTTTTYYLNTQNPVLNIINRITQKFANTAEFIAGMLRAAVPQQQAPMYKDDILRRFCNRLRKNYMSHTNNNNQNKKKHYQRF